MKFTTIVIYALLSVMLSCSSTKSDIKLSRTNPVIYFDRSACFGACPAYTLTLRGDGSAEYIGRSNVENVGVYQSTVDRKSLLLLANEFEKIKFFTLKEVYDAEVTDIPTFTLRYTLNDSTKTVTDRFAPPPGLRDLEKLIDEIADKLDWKKVSD